MLLVVYGDKTMSCARSFEWFKRFKEDRTNVVSDKRDGFQQAAMRKLSKHLERLYEITAA